MLWRTVIYSQMPTLIEESLSFIHRKLQTQQGNGKMQSFFPPDIFHLKVALATGRNFFFLSCYLRYLGRRADDTVIVWWCNY